MSDARNENQVDDVEFSWGSKKGRGGTNRDVQFYESFTYDGVEYRLYDSVYMYNENEPEHYIGKLIQIFELPNKARKVKVLWFFRPSDVSNYLGGVNVLDNELFLATGCGKGLANVNPLEAISGKCNAACISKDHRNRQLSVAEVKTADYVFYRTFDVQYHTISDVLGEKIAMIHVKYLLNKNEFLLLDPANVDSGNLALNVEDQLISVDGSPVANKALEKAVLLETQISNVDKGTKYMMDNSKVHPPEGRDDVGVGSMKDREKKLVSGKGTLGAHEYILRDAVVGSLLVKNDKGLKEKADATRHDNMHSVDLCDSRIVSGADQESRSRSPDFEQNKIDKVTAYAKRPSQSSSFQKFKLGKSVNSSDAKANNRGLKLIDIGKTTVTGPVLSTSVSDKGETKFGKGIHIGTGTGQKSRCVNDGSALEEHPSKKLKLDAFATLPRDDGGTSAVQKLKSVNDSGALELDGIALVPRDGGVSTEKSATVSAANNKASRPSGAAADILVNNKSGNQLAGTSNGFIRMPKSINITDNKSNDKLCKLSTMQSKALEKYAISETASKIAAQPARIAVDTNDRTKFDSGTSVGLVNKLKSNGAIRGKSICKPIAIQAKDIQKSALASNTSNRAPPLADVGDSDDAKISKGSGATKDYPSRLKSKGIDDKSKGNLQELSIKQYGDVEHQAYGRRKEVTQRPPDQSRWVRAGCVPWKERMKEARDQGTLVLLQNLDPTYTSLQVEDIVWHGFGYGCTAKMVAHTATSSPHSGQAFAIFKTQVIANKVIGKLAEECLMLPNGRPLVGSSWVLSFPGKQSSFPGHLVIDKVKHQTLRDSKEAVSTSHSSQPNNLEYEMALDWCVLQEKSDKWWKKLHKVQREEIEKSKARLKSK